MSEIPHLLVHHPDDSVGVVVVEDLCRGTDMLVCVTHDNSTFRLTAQADVPIGHKIALRDMKTGARVRKYNEDIGVMTADVVRGGHLHTHNCVTGRWQKGAQS